MISYDCRFSEFSEFVKDKSIAEILYEAVQEKQAAEQMPRHKDTHDRYVRYAATLGAFIYALRYNVKSTDDSEFQRFRPIWEALVARKELPPESLTVFDQAKGATG